MTYYNPERDADVSIEQIFNDFNVNLLPESHHEWLDECGRLTSLKSECLKQWKKVKEDKATAIKQWQEYALKIQNYKKQVDAIPTPKKPRSLKNSIPDLIIEGSPEDIEQECGQFPTAQKTFFDEESE